MSVSGRKSEEEEKEGADVRGESAESKWSGRKMEEEN